MDFGNGLNDWNTYTLDYELDVLGLYDGSADIINRAHSRTDNLNLTNIYEDYILRPAQRWLGRT